jgi:hypothetical protein
MVSGSHHQVPVPTGEAGELIDPVPLLIRLGPALLLALFPMGVVRSQEQPEAPPTYASVRSNAFEALELCVNQRKPEPCTAADTALQHLIRSAEAPEQRLVAPRCLSALTRVETSLNTFRWRLETTTALQAMVNGAASDCPAASASLGH